MGGDATKILGIKGVGTNCKCSSCRYSRVTNKGGAHIRAESSFLCSECQRSSTRPTCRKRPSNRRFDVDCTDSKGSGRTHTSDGDFLNDGQVGVFSPSELK